MLQRGEVWPLNITLFELYPSYTGSNPAWSSSKGSFDVGSGTAVQDLVVLDSTIEITDVVSGLTSPSSFIYSDALYDNINSMALRAPPALNYTMIAATPLPSPPYALPLTILATRNSPEGAAQVSYKAFIPILGTIPSEVPNYYPVTTDPTLIFLILRDPPGGTSQTTISAGTTFSTAIAISGMKTFETQIQANSETSINLGTSATLDLAPAGLGESTELFKDANVVGIKATLIAPDVTVTRTSDTHYSYAFKFSYDFSTSGGAFSAGHPSDVIVGGGIDVIVSEALEGIYCYPKASK